MIVKAVRLATKAYSKTIGPYMPQSVKVVLRKVQHSLVGRQIEQAQQEELYQFYRSIAIVSPGDLVFDVGANTGVFAQAFLRLGAKVVCIEPDPANLALLRSQFGSNADVQIVEAGLGEKDGVLDLYISDRHASSTFSPSFKSLEEGAYKGNYVGKVQARLTTLDVLIEKFGTPSYCKIDVEGFERQVLSGLHSRIKYFSFEFHKETLGEAEACADLLQRLGPVTFNYTHHDPTKQPMCLSGWVGKQQLFEAIRNEPKSIMDATGDINMFRVGDIFAKID